MEESSLIIIILILFVMTYFFIYLILYIIPQTDNNNNNHNNNHNNHNYNHKKGSCDVKTCGALDPVSNPAYNMQQIVKQSILLEEHITNKNKRCRDCITKHFLHIIGLAEEAQMLATNKCNKFPLINESVELYNRLFNDWIKHKDDNYYLLTISNELRIHRKKLIAVYFFNDNYDLNNFSKSSQG
jgi:hypothetical protein